MFHYHLHSDGSILDGTIRIDRLVLRAKELGMTALGITDHGNMIKAFEFQKECLKQNIKPVIGCEFYLGEEDSKDKFHLICLAKNNTGLKNLYKLNTYSYTKNFYYKPRISFSKLIEHKDGLIVTTACLGSEFANIMRNKGISELKDKILQYKSIFGDDFYLEIQPNSIEEQKIYNHELYRLGNELGIKCVIACDSHYIYKEDAEAHDTMLCIQTGKKKYETDRFKMPEQDYYIKEDREIIRDLKAQNFEYNDISIMINNTNEIADKCNINIETGLDLLPKFDTGNKSMDFVLAEKCNEGYKYRYGNVYRKDVVDRVKYELDVIKQKGYSGYFLIVEDFLRWAREQGIRVGVGRGSIGGSMVAYLLRIHDVDPIKYGLYFERFLNPSRNSPPDCDSDFDYERREEVINYVQHKYGLDNVCHIVAEGKMTCKAVCRKVLSAYDFEQRYINRICKSIPEELGITLTDAYNKSEEFRNYMIKHSKQYNEMLQLENLISHTSQHAAGIIIAPDDITNYVPCMSVAGNREMKISQWHKKHIEEIGLYKFDFLGLKTLSILEKTIKNIKKLHDIDIDLSKIDLEDEGIYKQLNSGHLAGIFQFEAPSAKQIVNKVKPTCFNDIVVCEAICRPGVKEADLYINNKSNGYKKTGIKEIDDILEQTYGAIVYQEQTMLIMNKIAGWDLGKADSMRKVKNLEEYREDFVNSAINNGFSDVVANSIFDRFDMSYSFNKAHAVAYGITTAQTAWLLYYYPKEFMASVMSIAMLGSDKDTKIQLLIKECNRLGIKIMPPDINVSTNEFVATHDGIRLPLSMIANVGDKAVEEIMKKRLNGYSSIEDMYNRVEKKKVGKKVFSNLIKAGTFDTVDLSFMGNRVAMLNHLYALRKDEVDFSYTWCDELLYQFEKEVLGMYLTKNPLDGHIIPNFDEIEEGNKCCIPCIVSEVKIHKDKRGNDMAFVTLENKSDVIQAVVFSKTYKDIKNYLVKGLTAKVIGKKDNNNLIIDMMEVI